MKSREVVKELSKAGWREKLPRKKGSHRYFIHPDKPGKVAVPEHKGQDLTPGILDNIETQTGVKLR